MKCLFAILVAVTILVGFASPTLASEIQLHISGNCNRVGVAGMASGDVLVDGKLVHKSGVAGIGVPVSPGKHHVQVNGYCMKGHSIFYSC